MKNKISFHHLGNYFIAIKPLAQLLGCEVIVPPPITKKTMEIGCKYSPESVCVPFKYQIGNYIEAIEKGANILVQAGGGCRFGYYAEVQEQILKDLGFKVSFLKMQNNYSLIALIKRIKQLNPKVGYLSLLKAVRIAFNKAVAIEDMEDIIRKNIGFEQDDGEFERNHRIFLSRLDRAEEINEIKNLKKEYLNIFSRIKINKPENPIRVAIVGEVYVVMNRFPTLTWRKNLEEKELRFTGFLRQQIW